MEPKEPKSAHLSQSNDTTNGGPVRQRPTKASTHPSNSSKGDYYQPYAKGSTLLLPSFAKLPYLITFKSSDTQPPIPATPLPASFPVSPNPLAAVRSAVNEIFPPEYSVSASNPSSKSTITIITTTDLFILRCSSSSLPLLGRPSSSLNQTWLSSLFDDGDHWTIEQIKAWLTSPPGSPISTNRLTEKRINELEDAALESPTQGTPYPDRDVKLKRLDGTWSKFNLRMHLGRGGGLDLRFVTLAFIPSSFFHSSFIVLSSNVYEFLN